MASLTTSPMSPTTAEVPDGPICNPPTHRMSPIEKLPVELLHMIARSLPLSGNIIGMGFTKEAEKIPLTTKPSDLYPLARTCKGFWNCLSTLLYEFDIAFSTRLVGSSFESSKLLNGKLPRSAFLWGIQHNEMGTVKLALSIAQSKGRLGRYIGAHFFRLKLFWNLPSTAAVYENYRAYVGDRAYVGALVQAVSDGNTAMVRVLAQVADATMLNRSFHCHEPCWKKYGHDSTNMPFTALHLAIILRHADIVEVLLTRYSQLASTLQWYEPTALPIAAWLGDVDMARLILDGTSSDSPWTARARSQLVDPRAYTIGARGSGEPLPPMIMAGLGMDDGRLWHKDGDQIFSFLAARGGQHLLTEPFDIAVSRSEDLPKNRTPLDLALGANPDDYPRWKDVTPFDEARIIALIKMGAFSAIPIHSHPRDKNTICWLWQWWGYIRRWDSERNDDGVKFMEDCWDAAVESRQGNIDQQFIGFWVRGVTRLLDYATYPYWYHIPRNQLRNVLEAHLALISMLESKAPGCFKQFRPIRGWLDRRIFQTRGSGWYGVDIELYHDLMKGDWEHLR